MASATSSGVRLSAAQLEAFIAAAFVTVGIAKTEAQTIAH